MLTICCGTVELSSTVQLHNNYEILWKLWMTKHFVPVYRCWRELGCVAIEDECVATNIWGGVATDGGGNVATNGHVRIHTPRDHEGLMGANQV